MLRKINWFHRLSVFSAIALGLCVTALAHADGPPMSNGVIAAPILVENQAIAKAQAVGAITTFMTKGAQTCDSAGKNCHSVFGADDQIDYGSVQAMAQTTSGVQGFSFLDEDGSSSSISAQTATLALACGDYSTKMLAGIAFKATACQVNTNGDSRLTFKVCTAPARSFSVSPASNAMTCQPDPTKPNFTPTPGKVCSKPTCDTEAPDSQNGWSSPMTVSWTSSMASASEEDKAKNGLGLIFFPPLANPAAAGLASGENSNMTAVKVVESFYNADTKKTAVGLRLAYRHKATVTRDMMIAGPSAVPDPGAHTAQWDTITKLQSNPLIPQLGATYAKNGSDCIQQIQDGLASDGTVHVCDETYNKNGIKPLAKTAKIAAEGENCGTTEKCLQEVVNTNTWSQTCRSDVPLSMRKCTTTTDFSNVSVTSTRTRNTEICHETRLNVKYSCSTSASLGTASLADFTQQPVIGGKLTATVGHPGTGHYTISGNMVWDRSTGVSSGTFTFFLDTPTGKLSVSTESSDDSFVMAHNGLTFLVAGGSRSYSVPLQTGAMLGPTKAQRVYQAAPGNIAYIAPPFTYFDQFSESYVTDPGGPSTFFATAKVSNECFNKDVTIDGTLAFMCGSDGHTYWVQSVDLIGDSPSGSVTNFDLVAGANTISVSGYDPGGGGYVQFNMDILNYAPPPPIITNGCSIYE